MRRNSLDFAANRSTVLARLLSSDRRKGRTDESLCKIFDEVYPLVEEEGADIKRESRLVEQAEANGVRDRWRERSKARFAAAWAMKPQAIDPFTLWVIYEIVSILIQVWLERRRQRLGS